MEGKGNKTKNRMMEGSQVMESGEREEEWDLLSLQMVCTLHYLVIFICFSFSSFPSFAGTILAQGLVVAS